MLKKLKNSLLRLNIILLSVVMIISFSVIYLIIWRSMQADIQEQLRSVPAGVISNAIISDQQDGSSRLPGRVPISGRPELAINYSKVFVVNLGSDNSVMSVFSRLDLKDRDYIKAVNYVLKKKNFTGSISLAGRRWEYRVSQGQGNSIVFLDVQDVHDALWLILRNMLIVGIFVLGVLALISYYFASRAIRPVEESIRRQRRFVSDASHELKTPLAIINSNAEAIMADKAATVESQQKWLDRIGEESDRMNTLIDSMLQLARSEESSGGESLPADISEAAEKEINRVEAILFEKGISLTFKKSVSKAIARCDAERIRQAILILLDNAVKYTENGGKVLVETGCSRNMVFVRVSNTGSGIPKEDLSRIFDRFYRVDKSRNSSPSPQAEAGVGQSGYGLGLAIAKNIVERDRGRIRVDAEEGTVTFTIELPPAN